MRGFSLISTIALTFIFTALAFSILIMSDEGFRITRSSANFNIAEVNADHAVNQGISDIISGQPCGNSSGGSINGGQWSYRSYPVSSNMCYILGEGRKDNAVRYKAVFISTGGGGDFGTLTVNSFEGASYFNLINKSVIKGSEDCPALAYYNCGDVCQDIKDEEKEGQIESIKELAQPLNIKETIFKEGIDIDQIKQFIKAEYDNVYENYIIPEPPGVDNNCRISGATSCGQVWGQPSVLSCNTSNGQVQIDTNNCTFIEITGNDISFNFWQADIKSNLIIRADKVSNFSVGNSVIGNTTVSDAGIYIYADEVNGISFNNISTLKGNLVIDATSINNPISLVNDTEIQGSIIVLSRGDLEIDIPNQSSVKGDVFFTGKNFTLDPANDARIDGDIIVKADESIELDLVNSISIGGRLYFYANDIHIRGVNKSSVGDTKQHNFIIANESIYIELTNNAKQGNIGYVTTLNDNASLKIRLTNQGELEGLFISDILDVDLVNNSTLEGIILVDIVKREIRMPNNSKIKGLLVVFDDLKEMELVNRAEIEGLILADKLTKRFRMTNKAEIIQNIDLVNQYIQEFGLENFLKLLSCEGGSGNEPVILHGLKGSLF